MGNKLKVLVSRLMLFVLLVSNCTIMEPEQVEAEAALPQVTEISDELLQNGYIWNSDGSISLLANATTASQIDVTATATFLDGHTEVVTCELSGFDPHKYNVDQTCTLSYGEYKGTAKVKEKTTCTIIVHVLGYFNLSVNTYTSDGGNGGSASFGGKTTESILYGTNVTLVATPNEGYEFVGWKLNGGSSYVGTGLSYTHTMGASDATYTACFKPSNFDLTVSTQNEGKGTVSGSGTYAFNTTQTIKATPKAGFSFVGWYDLDTGSIVSDSATYSVKIPARNLRLQARWRTSTITVSFNANGGSCSPTSKTVRYGDIYGALPKPTKAGYTFVGWKLGSNYVTSSDTCLQSANHTLVAEWVVECPDKITVIYDENWGGLPTPVKTGYVFQGWFFQEDKYGNGDMPKDNPTKYKVKESDLVKITEPITIHAGWIPKQCILKFDSNGGSACANSKVDYDRTYGYYASLPRPTRSGYTFMGWYSAEVNDEAIGTQITDGTLYQGLNCPVTLYAAWELGTPQTTPVTVTLDPMGGTVSPTTVQRNYPGVYGTLPSAIPPNEFLKFLDWFPYPSGGTEVGSGPLISSNNHTLYAHYGNSDKGNALTLTVKGYIDGSTVTDLSSLCKFDVIITHADKSEIVYTDCTSFSMSNMKYGDSYRITNIRTLDGRSSQGVIGGSDPLVGTFSKGTTIVTLDFSYNSYTLTVSPDTSLCEQASPATTKTYTVTYGSTSNNTINLGCSLKGHSYLGYYDLDGVLVYSVTGADATNTDSWSSSRALGTWNKSATKYWTSDGKWCYAGDVTLILKFNPNAYTVTFASSVANTTISPYTSKTVIYGETYGELPTASAPGYKPSSKWFTSATSGTEVTSGAVVLTAANHTVYSNLGRSDSYENYTVVMSAPEATSWGTKSVGVTYKQLIPDIEIPAYVCNTKLYTNYGSNAYETVSTSHQFTEYYSKSTDGSKKESYWNSLGKGLISYTEIQDITVYAKWTMKSFSLPNKSRTGYTFAGWYNMPVGGTLIGGAGLSYTPVTDDDLYAHWDANKYNIQFDANGGTFVSTFTSKDVVFDSPYGDLPIQNLDVTRRGHTLVGWSLSKDDLVFVEPSTIVSTAGNHTLYAVWDSNPVTFSVNMTYNTHNGIVERTVTKDLRNDIVLTFDVYIDGNQVADDVTSFSTSTTKYGSNYTVKDVKVNPNYKYSFANVGYVYNGTVGGDLTGSFTTDDCICNGDSGVYYVWLNASPVVNEVLFDTQGGDMPEGVDGHFELWYNENKNSYISVPTKLGYDFLGWFDQSEGGNMVYDSSGKWYGTKYWSDGYWRGTSDTTIYAQWSVKSVPVIFDNNNPDSPDSFTKEFVYDKTTPILSTTDGTWGIIDSWNDTYIVKYITGWSTDPHATVSQVRFEHDASLDEEFLGLVLLDVYTTLYAVWDYKFVTVHYNRNSTASDTAYAEETFSTEFTNQYFSSYGADFANGGWDDARLGWTFRYWSYQREMYTKPDSEFRNLVAHNHDKYYEVTNYWIYQNWSYDDPNVTVYGVWTPNAYEVTLDLNRGSLPNSSIPLIPIDKYLVLFDNSVHHYDSNAYKDYLGSSVDNIGSNPLWYSIFNASSSRDHFTMLTEAAVTPTRVGYDFDGWYMSNSGGTKIYDSLGSVAKDGQMWNSNGKWKYPNDTVFYAMWTPKVHTIVFNARGGTGNTASVTITYDTAGQNIVVPTKRGWEFIGFWTTPLESGSNFESDLYSGIQYWDETGKFTGYYSSKTLLPDGITVEAGDTLSMWKIDSSVTLYARWKPCPEPTVIATPIPTITPIPEEATEGKLEREDTHTYVYADDYDSSTTSLSDTQPYLTENGIPSTEMVNTRSRFGSYVLKYAFNKNTGVETVLYEIEVPYQYCYVDWSNNENLVYISKDSSGNQLTTKYTFEIPKAWAYWIITNIGMFKPSVVRIENQSFTESVEFELDWENNATALPAYNVDHSETHRDHVYWDDYVSNPSEYASNMGYLYFLCDYDVSQQTIMLYQKGQDVPTASDLKHRLYNIAQNAAVGDEREAHVLNDGFDFSGNEICVDSIIGSGNDCPKLELNRLPKDIEYTQYSQSYFADIDLNDAVRNDTYPTDVTVTHKVIKELVDSNMTVGDVSDFNLKVKEANDIVVHTPVVVDIMSNTSLLTLDDDFKYFTISLTHTKEHSNKLGYGNRNHQKPLNPDGNDNIAELRLYVPFDAFFDVNSDGDISNDIKLTANTWYVLPYDIKKFNVYVPVTTEDGIYDVSVMAIGINCPKDASGKYVIDTNGVVVNNLSQQYAAVDTVSIVVESAVLGVDILDADSTALTIGDVFSFRTKTAGRFTTDSSMMVITPKYYYVSSDGSIRTEIRLYEDIEGGIKPYENSSSVVHIKNNDEKLNISKLFNNLGLVGSTYTSTEISINSNLRYNFAMSDFTYCSICGKIGGCSHSSPINLADYNLGSTIYQDWYGKFGINFDTLAISTSLIEGTCSNCGKTQYALIENAKCSDCHSQLIDIVELYDNTDFMMDYLSKNTFTGNEDFLLTDGYVVVNFDVVVYNDLGTAIPYDIPCQIPERGYLDNDVVRYSLDKDDDDYNVDGAE